MKLENVPDELLDQGRNGSCAQLLIRTNTVRHYLRNLRQLHDWPRCLDDASR